MTRSKWREFNELIFAIKERIMSTSVKEFIFAQGICRTIIKRAFGSPGSFAAIAVGIRGRSGPPPSYLLHRRQRARTRFLYGVDVAL